uniref:Transmembrane protein n=1 Tax=Panagrolaimus sp. JU765 TaxID=591449 RepID=A0AC34PUV4_9BILA
MASPAPSTDTDQPMQIFVYAAPVILGLSIILCFFRLFLIHCLHLRTRITESPSSTISIEGEDQPSTIARAFARSPFFEMFRQAPPPPTYDEMLKHARETQVAQSQSTVIEISDETCSIDAPLEANAPPPYQSDPIVENP